LANKKGIQVAISSTSAISNGAIDVATIVSSLMTAEQRPLDAINKKITSKELVISELGVVKTKVSSLLGALKTFEDPNTYINTSVQSDNPAVLNATASNSAQVGSYVVSVDQVAKATLYNIAGFSSASATLNTNTSAGFQLTVGTTTYSTDGSKTVSGVVTANAISAIGTSPTAQALEDWINELRSVTQISATLSKMDDNQYALFIRGDREGDDYDFSISGLQTDVSISGFSSENDLVSLDAVNGFQLTVDGITYKTSGTGDNLSAITGTGANGAILLKDIVTWIAELSADHELNLLPSVLQNGDVATFNLAQEVENASAISIAGIGASSEYPLLISSTLTQADETADFTFSNLKQGDSLTIAGLTMVAKQDITAIQAATAFNTMRDGATANVVSSITNGSRSDAKTDKATIEISNVNLPTSAGTYKLTSLKDILTMTKYVDGVASTTASIQILTSGSSNPSTSPPKVLFQSVLNGKTDLSFGELGSFRINTVLAATSTETATEIASKILNAVDSAGQVTANAWVSIPDADWAGTAKTNLGGTDSYKVVVTTTGATKIRIGTTSSLTAVTGYNPTLSAYTATGGVSEMAFTGTAASLSAALKTLEANGPDGLGKVAVHIVPHNNGTNSVSVRVDSVTGSISYYRRFTGGINWTNANTAANSSVMGTLNGYLSNVSSSEESSFLSSKGIQGSGAAWIGGTDAATYSSLGAAEGKFIYYDGPEKGLEFFVSRFASGGNNLSKVNAMASPSITAGSITQSEVRTWSISNASAITVLAGKTFGFVLTDPNDPTKKDTVYYTNTSSSSQSISTALANLKTYFDANSNISTSGSGYSITGTKNSTSPGALGLFSQFNFTYSMASNNLSGAISFTGKTAGAITDGKAASFQIRGINLYSGFPSNEGEPNGNTSENMITTSGTWNDLSSAGSANGYIIEYNADANSTILRREFSIPSPGVITIDSGSDPNVVSALNYGSFSGAVSGYTTSLSGDQLTFTSTQLATNITPNISYAFTPAAGSPTVFGAPVITDGGNGTLATASLQFPPSGLQAGDSISVAGLTFTASRASSSTEIAAAFANLANGATTGAGSSYGSYSGALADFSSGSIVNSNQLLFTQIPSGTQTSINTSSGSTKAIVGTGLTVDKHSTAQNAIFAVGDTSYTKTSNTISDAITGITFSLMEEGEANILVELGEDKSEEIIKGLMTAYNDLIKSANAMTANSSNSLKPGAFANSPTSLSFISDIKRKVVDGARYDIGKTDSSGQPYRLSLASLGLEYQLDGTLAFNRASLLTAQSSGLREKLLSGLKVGYQSSVDNLSSMLAGHLSSISSLAYQTSESTQSVASLNKEKDLIEDRLEKIQAGYIAQYSNLNKLLFQLNSTSTSLRSALDGLTNMNSNK
jgi:flagellar hook-associated protein 2